MMILIRVMNAVISDNSDIVMDYSYRYLLKCVHVMFSAVSG
jgi:hypothetical protein